MTFLKATLTENKQKGKNPLFSEWGQRSVRWCGFSPAHTRLLCSKQVTLNYFLKCIVLPPQDHLLPSQSLCTGFWKHIGVWRGSVWTWIVTGLCSTFKAIQATQNAGSRHTHHFTLSTVWNDEKEQEDIKVWTMTIWTHSFGWKVLEVHSVSVQNDKLSQYVLQWQSEPQATSAVEPAWGLGHMRRLLIKYQPSGHSAVDTATISQGHL